MPKRNSTNSTECPGTIVDRDEAGREIRRRQCTAIITVDTTFCRKCKTTFLKGSLMTFRLAPHARRTMPRSWSIRYLRG